MNFKQTLKSYLLHLKDKWFVYATMVVIFVILWYVVLWGSANKVARDKELFIWFTPNNVAYQEFEEGTAGYKQAEANYKEVNALIDLLKSKHKTYGYEKFKSNVANADKSNNEQITAYVSYADQGGVDIFIMPNYVYTSDSEEGYPNADERINDSNETFVRYYMELENLFDAENENYSNFASLLTSVTTIDFTRIDYHGEREYRKNIAIKINDDYYLSINKYHTTNSETLYDMVKDIIQYINA